MDRLKGKVAIVTGAGTGLGRETALLYAEEGAKVAVADVRAGEGEETVRLIHSAGGEAFFAECDVSSAEAVRRVVADTERAFGALHVMTANAGILGRGAGKRFGEVSVEELEQIMAVNFWGVVHSLQAAIDPIESSGGGAMTVTASLASHFGYPTLPGYSASKHAVLGVVKSLAADLAPRIRVNAVSAGSMATQIGVHTAEEQGREPGGGGSGVVRADKDDHFRAHPRQVAFAHLFLASDEASFVSGQALVVDGGRTVTPAM